MATIAQNLETINTALSTMKTNLNLDEDASLSDVVAATSGGGGSVEWTDYFNPSIKGGNNTSQGLTNGIAKLVKKIPITITPTSTSMAYAFQSCAELLEAPAINMSDVTNMTYTFYTCSKMETVPLYDTSKVTSFYLCLAGTKISTFPAWDLSKGQNLNSMFSGCTSLANVPLMDWSSATNLSNIFYNCSSLTDTSLDNILQSCITATSYANVKNLAELGLSSANYSSAKIQSLPHYQQFVASNWSIGY